MENDAENEWLYGGCYIRKDNEHGICVATIPPCQRHERGNAPVTPLERRIKAMNEKLKSMVDTIMEQLEKMTAEERLEWFANDPALHLRFMHEMDGTT